MPRSGLPSPPMESILACTHCAKAKAKCDRKVPCTRCVERKIDCQTRPPRRGLGRSSLSQSHCVSKSKRPLSRRSTDGSFSVRSDTADSVVIDGTDNVYMDWSMANQDLDLVGFAVNHQLRGIDPVAAGSGVDGGFTFAMDGHEHFGFGLPSPTAHWTDFAEIPLSEMDLPLSSCEKDGVADSNIPGVLALEGWPMFKCNPVCPSSACPPTAARHVKNLHALLEKCRTPIERCRSTVSSVSPAPLLASTSEKLIAVLQGLFNDAQQVYGLRGTETSQSGLRDSVGASILLLPPAPVLEFPLKAYLDCCEPYYPFAALASLRLNERMERPDPVLPSTFLLLTLATGAMTAGAGESSYQVAYGFLELCRISLGRLIEQDLRLASDPEFLQCALLLTIAAVWSGDKWLMDTAGYQKAMFLEMHLRGGFQEDRDTQLARLESTDDVDSRWQMWEEQEGTNRLTYSWLILDHEICLFQDIPPPSFLSITGLNAPMPSPDAIWNLQSAKHWMQGMAQSPGGHSATIPPSLDEYVRCFRDTSDISTMAHVSPTTLRLLLCYLQNVVINLRCSIDGIPSKANKNHRSGPNTSLVLLSVQCQEAQELLQKWYELARTCRGSSEGTPSSSSPSSSPSSSEICSAAANMILYHLIMLNTMVSFPEIERSARADPGSLQIPRPGPAPWQKRVYHLESAREIYFHCAQILRIIRSTSEPERPSWWAGALYRVALIAWANSMSCGSSTSSSADGGHAHASSSAEHTHTVVLDGLPADHSSIVSYLDHQGGIRIIPVFSDSTGGLVSLDCPVDIVRHCARLVDSDIKTQFSLGIQQKLLRMACRWEGIV